MFKAANPAIQRPEKFIDFCQPSAKRFDLFAYPLFHDGVISATLYPPAGVAKYLGKLVGDLVQEKFL